MFSQQKFPIFPRLKGNLAGKPGGVPSILDGKNMV
jgi:hypothetical protein